ncbi:MAG: glycoside hydrolase family 3 protein [Clostridiales bacterium]|nr:glycoside hydrolase family 3 protein [Clostridiales bacterium]
MKRRTIRSILILTAMSMILSSCSAPKKHEETLPADLPRPTVTTVETEPTETEETLPPYHCINPKFEGLTAEEVCALLTVEEKANQMVQGANYNMPLDEMQKNCYGSVLSHYPEWPASPQEEWAEVVFRYQDAALLSDTRIPFIYANDCTHGVLEARGSVIFPQNINIGAADDEKLTYEMGILTGSDMMHCGFLWSFSPCVATAQDPRWGRTYESYSTDTALVTKHALAYTKGLQTQGIAPCPKHFLGDGNVVYGTGEGENLIDRGDAKLTEEEIQKQLAVYKELIDAGVPSIMLSHSSLNGKKMHENTELIRRLREDLGFKGVILSDWESLHNCSGASDKENVILCVNAGCDMLMEGEHYAETRDYLIEAINEESIPMERIDEAVTHILQLKMDLGLFRDPFLENRVPSYEWNSDHAHSVARELAQKSMVPLVLPEDGPITLKEGMKVYVMGPAADDTGVLCGGWTYLWQGGTDADAEGGRWCTEGPTIMEALKASSAEIGFEIVTDPEQMEECDVILLCVGEKPYAEWYGDTEDLSITGALALDGNKEAIAKVAEYKKSNEGKKKSEQKELKPVITLIVAGRNVLISDYVADWDEVVMCYLPGSEGGNAVSDILTGKASFYGRLPMPYYSSIDQIGSETGEVWLPVGFSAAEKKEEGQEPETTESTEATDAN